MCDCRNRKTNKRYLKLLIVSYICEAKLVDECWWLIQFVSLGSYCGGCLTYTRKLKDLLLIPSFTQPQAELEIWLLVTCCGLNCLTANF